MGLGQSECGGCGTTDVVAIGQPLVANGAQTVGICEVVTGGQYLTLGGGAAYRDTARGGVIGVDYRSCSRAGDALSRAQ